MTYIQEQVHNHPVHQALVELDNAISDADLKLPDDDTLAAYNRMLRVVAHTRATLDQANSDPEVVLVPVLDSLQTVIQNLKSNFFSFKDALDWKTLNNHVENVLEHCARLRRGVATEVQRDFSTALDEFRRRAYEQIEGIQKRRVEEEEAFAAARNKIEELDRQIQQQAQQFEQQKGRLDQLITTETTRFSEIENQRNEQFSQKQNEREAEFKQLAAVKSGELNVTLTKAKSDLETLLSNQRESGDQSVAGLKAQLEDAKRIVGLIGNTGMAGHYQLVANQERVTANYFRAIALLFFVAMVGVVAWVVHEVRTDNFNWEVAIFRIAVAVTLIAPALYCARESGKHRAVEQRNRRLELEFASINPYLGTLPPEKSQAVIEKLAAQYFGNQHSEPEADAGSHLKDIYMRGDEVLKLLERIAKLTK